MFVREVMTAAPVVVVPDTPVKAALMLLDEHGITSLPVVTDDGRICGVVSEADLIRELVLPDHRRQLLPDEGVEVPRPGTVQDVMTPHAVTVRPGTDLAAAVALVTSTMVKSLPVVDEDDRVVGVLSRRDVIRVLARRDEDLAREIDELLVATGRHDWLVDVRDGIAHVDGPVAPHEVRLALAVARSVPGVVTVRIGRVRDDDAAV